MCTTVAMWWVHPRKWSSVRMCVPDKLFMSLMVCLHTVHTHPLYIQFILIHGPWNPWTLCLWYGQLIARESTHHWGSRVVPVMNYSSTRWSRGSSTAIDTASPRAPHITGWLWPSWQTCLMRRTLNLINLNSPGLIWLDLFSRMHHTLMPTSGS